MEQATALVGLNKDYLGQLEQERANLETNLKTQQAIADKTKEAALSAGVSPQAGGPNLWDLYKGAKAEAQAETFNGKLETINKTLGLADAALKTAQADAINAGTALNDHLATNAEKSAKQLDQLVEASSKLHRLLGVPMDLQINVSDVGDDIFKIGQMLEKLPQPQLPVYAGTKEAEDLYKIQTQQAAAIMEHKRLTRPRARPRSNHSLLTSLTVQGYKHVVKINLTHVEGQRLGDSASRVQQDEHKQMQPPLTKPAGFPLKK